MSWADKVDEQERQLAKGIKQVQLDAPRTEPISGKAPASADSTSWENEESAGYQAPVQKEDAEEDKPPSAAEASYLNKVLHSELVQTTVAVKVDVQQKDPNSPLYSVRSFEELKLSRPLLDGVYNMGFNTPSKIQETALPALMADPPSNMIAQSQSGTGKTASFVLALLHRVDEKKRWPQVLVLSPTYELACQIGEVITKMAKYLPDVKMIFAVKGQRVERGETLNQQIIVGTPGTVQDWLTRRHCFDPKKIRVFVLDEADIMIMQQGFQDQSVRIQRALAPQCQMMLFSATYSPDVMDFAKKVIPDPIVIRLKKEEETLNNIRQYFVRCANEHEKFQALSNIYGVVSIGQAMVFCQTRKSAKMLSEKMGKDGHAVALLSGELTVEDRATVLNRFRDAKEKLLITTNVCARGIDVEQVTVVVNYDIPVEYETRLPDYETYLHRIGRTGRFGKSGLAINFVDGRRSYDLLIKIQEHFGTKINELRTDDVDEVEKLNA